MLAIQPASSCVTLSNLLQQSPANESRHAIYFTPPETSVWWRFGCEWLGRDAITGAPAPRRRFAGLDDPLIDRITRAPSLYGFHATLKAPIRLAQGYTACDVQACAARTAVAMEPVVLTPLSLEIIDGFVALTPAAGGPCMAAVEHIARQCVTAFDHMRAPASNPELRRREAAGLSLRQTALLHQWGYPFVLDEFRFHLTLSGRLGAHEQALVLHALAPVVGELNQEPLALDALSICMQPRLDAPFVLSSRHGFGCGVRRYSHE